MKPIWRRILFTVFLPVQLLSAQDWEARLLALASADSCRLSLQQLTSKPHVAGTVPEYELADFVRRRFAAAGLQTEVATYDVYLPHPVRVELEILPPFAFSGPTPEPRLRELGVSPADEIFPAFNAYSPSGETRGKVVYVNYGTREDYEKLSELGISVDGRIALARYGKIYRGSKAQLAEDYGALGLILYSDPADDGYMKGDIFPRGPFRPRYSVQSGTILYFFDYPGDPLTPGYAATERARRIAPEAATSLPRIHTLPLSYGDAEKLLQHLDGPNVPAGWQGGLPFAYHIGPGPVEAHLQIDMDESVRPIWNVLGYIRGVTAPDKLVVIGNHRDAWNYGAVDPGAGTSVMLEVARVFGALVREGYRPQRTIVFASWDAEEYGLLGSTEWVEEHRLRLAEHGIATINLDAAVSGHWFNAAGSPLLKPLLRDILQRVPAPQGFESLSSLALRQQSLRGQVPAPANLLRIGDLGTGTDHAPFVFFAGIPSMFLYFSGDYGVYHSVYDNFLWMEKFGDPDFLYHRALAQLCGLLLQRLAGDDILPFDIAAYATEMLRHAEELQAELRQQQAPHELDGRILLEQCRDWQQAAQELSLQAIPPDGYDFSALNHELAQFEREFIVPAGLPYSSWYRHQLYGPDLQTGYAPVVFPGIRYHIQQRAWQKAAQEIARVQQVLRGAAQRTRRIVALQQLYSGRR